jgi:excisionase family DNA binding protein
MITIKEFAVFMKVDPMTVRRWIKAGMPCVKIGQIIRIEKTDAMAWITEQRGA